VPASNTLNAPFSAGELDSVVKHLQRNKAADMHGLRAELLKSLGCDDDADEQMPDISQPLTDAILHLCN
jgi:hypothetical protein